MNVDELDRDAYLEVLGECSERAEGNQLENLLEIPEWKVEKVCDEAVGKQEDIGDTENPRVNAKVIALSIYVEDILDEEDMMQFYKNGREYLAELAHRSVKQDLINQTLDQRAETNREDR